MANGYNPAKAAEFNKLILDGIPYASALSQAGISAADIGNYSFDPATSVLSQEVGPPESLPTVDQFADPELSQPADPAIIAANSPTGIGDDPFLQAQFDAQLALDNEPVVELSPAELDAATDPFETARLEAEQALNREDLTQQATDLEPGEDPFEQARLDAQTRLDAEEPNFDAGSNVNFDDDPSVRALEESSRADAEARFNDQSAADQDAIDQAAAKTNALNQATLQARYKQPASSDWRVRLQLAPGANYLYKAGKDGSEAGILKPLYDTDGVIFPYTPSIETSYNANYEMYDLTHSNFRGYFYKNSRVNDINIRATFTAQDTQEAAYLLAVIHFFRSCTKMFYGAKDAYRGAPPPLTYLSGLGAYQFNNHPCVVSQFNYSLPPDVDYIRALAPNNYGQNMLTQRARTGAIAANPGMASLTRLLGTITKPPVGATATPPTPGMLNQNINNTSQATYVPTKIELSITLLPINTRNQVSTQFNMKEFASGALIKGGFW